MNIDLYKADGTKNGSVKLNPSMFEAKINKDLMHRAVIMRLANARNPIAHTKTRGEISATTKKAFKQKGTGNARRGAKSTNILRGGGVTHGPRNTANYSKMMPKKERRAALFSALSEKAAQKEIFALASFDEKAPTTKAFSQMLTKLPESKKYLFVIPEKNDVFQKSASNLPNVKVILASYMNPYDCLHAGQICFLKSALPKLEETFLKQ